MNKDSNVICPLGIIGRGCYTCFTDCALHYNDECLLRTYLLILVGEKTRKVEEEIRKMHDINQDKMIEIFNYYKIEKYLK